MALENAAILEELKKRYTETVTQVNELNNTRVKIEGAIDVLQQIEDSKEKEAQDADKSDSDEDAGSSSDGESSEGTDSNESDS
tara:strand:+ start:170 stop:418 length:249 start_codon:yes stop_codon:yes gene_type:complete